MKKLFTILLSSFLVLGACSHTDSSDKKKLIVVRSLIQKR